MFVLPGDFEGEDTSLSDGGELDIVNGLIKANT